MITMRCAVLLSVVAVICVVRVVASFIAPEGCSGRVVLNSTQGFISDGLGDYPASAHCEWLIEGQFSIQISICSGNMGSLRQQKNCKMLSEK